MKGLMKKSFGQFLAISAVAVSVAQAKNVPVSADLKNLAQIDTIVFNDATLVKWRKDVNLTAVPSGAITIDQLSTPNSAYPVRSNSKGLANDQGYVFTDNAVKVDYSGVTNQTNTAIVMYTGNTAGTAGLVATDGSSIPLVMKPFTEAGLKVVAALDTVLNTQVTMPNLVTVQNGNGNCPADGLYPAGSRSFGFCDFITRFVTNGANTDSFKNETDATKKQNAFKYASLVNNSGIVTSENGVNSLGLGRVGPVYEVLGVGTIDALPQSYSTTLVVEKTSI